MAMYRFLRAGRGIATGSVDGPHEVIVISISRPHSQAANSGYVQDKYPRRDCQACTSPAPGARFPLL